MASFVTVLLILLSVFTLSYIGLLFLVVAGMFRSQPKARNLATPMVSVIIPAHNEEQRLASALASLRRQQYAGRHEFIIVNDRSQDHTEAIIRSYQEKDSRFRLVNITAPGKRLSPKVNAVNTGIEASSGEIILTSDADCEFPDGWISEMVSHFEADVAMIIGYVETTRPHSGRSWLERFESVDWLSLMLTSRSLIRFGWKFASSANNQAYRRLAFRAIGGFGAGGRAPSGDEDLLTQRMSRLGDMRVVFASTPGTRVLTHPAPSLPALLRQRRRWISRYQHLMHYQPPFLAGIIVLGLQSILLAGAVFLIPLAPRLFPWAVGWWSAKLTVELTGFYLGSRQLGRRDLWGWPALSWALLHPFFISIAIFWSFIRPGDWRAGAPDYRRSFWLWRLRQLRRLLRWSP